MPALTSTEFHATVTWLGHVQDRETTLRSASPDQMDLNWGGMAQESHAGETRPACSRVRALYPKGAEIRNVRQLSIVCAQELQEIAETMGLAQFDPSWIGASMVVTGVPDFTHVPPSARLLAQSGASLVVDMENRPCHLPAKVIEADAPGLGARFKAAAKGKRGVTAWVERPGRIQLGDRLQLFVPDQPAWSTDA